MNPANPEMNHATNDGSGVVDGADPPPINLEAVRTLRSANRPEFGSIIARGFDSEGRPTGQLNGIQTNQMATQHFLKTEGIISNDNDALNYALNCFIKSKNITMADPEAKKYERFVLNVGLTFNHLCDSDRKICLKELYPLWYQLEEQQCNAQPSGSNDFNTNLVITDAHTNSHRRVNLAEELFSNDGSGRRNFTKNDWQAMIRSAALIGVPTTVEKETYRGYKRQAYDGNDEPIDDLKQWKQSNPNEKYKTKNVEREQVRFKNQGRSRTDWIEFMFQVINGKLFKNLRQVSCKLLHLMRLLKIMPASDPTSKTNVTGLCKEQNFYGLTLHPGIVNFCEKYENKFQFERMKRKRRNQNSGNSGSTSSKVSKKQNMNNVRSSNNSNNANNNDSNNNHNASNDMNVSMSSNIMNNNSDENNNLENDISNLNKNNSNLNDFNDSKDMELDTPNLSKTNSKIDNMCLKTPDSDDIKSLRVPIIQTNVIPYWEVDPVTGDTVFLVTPAMHVSQVVFNSSQYDNAKRELTVDYTFIFGKKKPSIFGSSNDSPFDPFGNNDNNNNNNNNNSNNSNNNDTNTEQKTIVATFGYDRSLPIVLHGTGKTLDLEFLRNTEFMGNSAGLKWEAPTTKSQKIVGRVKNNMCQTNDFKKIEKKESINLSKEDYEKESNRFLIDFCRISFMCEDLGTASEDDIQKEKQSIDSYKQAAPMYGKDPNIIDYYLNGIRICFNHASLFKQRLFGDLFIDKSDYNEKCILCKKLSIFFFEYCVDCFDKCHYFLAEQYQNKSETMACPVRNDRVFVRSSDRWQVENMEGSLYLISVAYPTILANKEVFVLGVHDINGNAKSLFFNDAIKSKMIILNKMPSKEQFKPYNDKYLALKRRLNNNNSGNNNNNSNNINTNPNIIDVTIETSNNNNNNKNNQKHSKTKSKSKKSDKNNKNNKNNIRKNNKNNKNSRINENTNDINTINKSNQSRVMPKRSCKKQLSRGQQALSLMNRSKSPSNSDENYDYDASLNNVSEEDLI